jgi:phosphoribosylamine--glycine ligase
MKQRSTRFNLVSETADGFGFAVRLQDEGYPVRMWARHNDARLIGDNMIEKVGDVDDLLEDAEGSDVFVFDTTGNGIIADYIRDQGFAVLGGSMLADRLERDRAFGYRVMKQAGIDVPKTKTFKSFEDAIEFVTENSDTRWVYKPSKQLGDLSASHVPFDTEDMVEMLQNVSKDVDIADPLFELQAFEKGTALSTEMWFQNGTLIEPLTNHTLERKELMNDDIGPSGGCLGNLTWFCRGCSACSQAKKLVPWAKRMGYHGMLDVNAIVTGTGDFYGLEFTPRFGYDASPTLLWELVKGGLGRFFEDVARGEVSELDLRENFAGSVRITIPPWPTEKHTAEENIPIRGITREMMESMYLYNVKKNDVGLCTAGGWGIICLFTGRSVSPVMAMLKPLDVCKKLRLKDKQYRTDLAKCFNNDLEDLRAAGVEINNVHEEVS